MYQSFLGISSITLLFATAFITILTVKYTKIIATKRNILDYPGGRKVHSKPTPLLGGVGIWIGAAVALSLTTIVLRLLSPIYLSTNPIFSIWQSYSENLPVISIIFISSALLVILGFFDDICNDGLHYRTKLIVEFLVAFIVVSSGIHFELFNISWINKIATIIWIIGIINAVNLLDGLDGLASGFTIIVSLTFLVIASIHHDVILIVCMSLLIGSSLGFFLYNKPPAKIFMGDSGSLFLGFFLALGAIMVSKHMSVQPSFIFYLVPVLILSLPIADTLSVSLIRILNKRSIFYADRNHLHHRLLDIGFDTKQAVTIILLLSTYISINTMIAFFINVVGITMVFFQTCFLFISMYYILHRIEHKVKSTSIRPANLIEIKLTKSDKIVIKEEVLN